MNIKELQATLERITSRKSAYELDQDKRLMELEELKKSPADDPKIEKIRKEYATFS